MTDIKLLPLPNCGSGFYEDNVWHDTFSKHQMEAYARANVEASTKCYRHMLCQSQDDVMKLREQLEWTVRQNDGLLNEGREYAARAGRMAGALRKIAALKVREYDDAVGIADETLDQEKGIG